MRLAVVILVLMLLASWLVIASLWRAQLSIRRNRMNAQTSISRAAAVIRSQDTVIGSAVLAMAAIRASYDAAIAKLKEAGEVDVSELEAASSEAEAASADLAKAVAANTDASDEVHADDGGTGTSDSGTVVDPADVDTSPVTDPPPEGGEGQSGTGSGGAVTE